MSIIQEGPGFPLFIPALYDYMVSGKMAEVTISDNEIPDLTIKHFVIQVST